MTTQQHKQLTDLLEKLVPAIKTRVTAYHNLFNLPLIAELWEETLHQSFKDIGETTTWTPNRSHAVGEDMRLEGIPNSRISCKSGQFITDRHLKTNCVKFNGSRSTRYETLEEKLAHFSQSHDDYYFLLAKPKSFDRKYQLLIFSSDICNVSKLEWTLSDSGKQWNGVGEFKALIGKSMSAQLWTTLPLEMISFSYDIDA